KKHDPYWDIPLNEDLPKPVIELPAISTPGGSLFDQARPKGKETAKPKTRSLDAELLEHLKQLLTDGQALSPTDVQRHLGLSPAALRPYLRQLVEAGWAVAVGKGRGLKYRPANQPPSVPGDAS